tara:strand:- start:3973 stop:4275 length:303 start_codon:yes stop_codon:yes gene_type:complete
MVIFFNETYELQHWLEKVMIDQPYRDEIIQSQVKCAHELMAYHGNSTSVCHSLLIAAVQVANVDAYSGEMSDFATTLRSYANTIDRMIENGDYYGSPKLQ